MIRDRGRIKWTAMMLPEHVKMLRDWVKEDGYEYKKELDEQQLEVMNDTIFEAMELNQTVAVTHYRGHKHELVVGHIHYWDQTEKKLRVVDHFDDIHHIELSNIADIRTVSR